MQKKKSVEEKVDITLSIVETAMAEELKASALYKRISAQLEDKAAKLKFDVMSEAEGKHYKRLKKCIINRAPHYRKGKFGLWCDCL